jgi:hypothetical protein
MSKEAFPFVGCSSTTKSSHTGQKQRRKDQELALYSLAFSLGINALIGKCIMYYVLCIVVAVEHQQEYNHSTVLPRELII